MKPLIGISCCTKLFGTYGMPNHAASDTYVRATDLVVGGVPVLIPANGGRPTSPRCWRGSTASSSPAAAPTCSPDLYQGPPHAEGTPEDAMRDAVTLPLIRGAVAAGIPVLAICRGMQEFNVALGGSLHQRLQDLPDRIDHSHADAAQPARAHRQGAQRAHRPGSWLHRIAGGTRNRGQLAAQPGHRPARARAWWPRRWRRTARSRRSAPLAAPGARRRRAVAPGIRLGARRGVAPDLRGVRRGGARPAARRRRPRRIKGQGSTGAALAARVRGSGPLDPRSGQSSWWGPGAKPRAVTCEGSTMNEFPGLIRFPVARRFMMTGLISGLTLATTRVEAQVIHTDTAGIDAGEAKVKVRRRRNARLFRPPAGKRPVPHRAGERGDLRRPRLHQGHLPPAGQGGVFGGRAGNLCAHRRPLENHRFQQHLPRRRGQGAGRHRAVRHGRRGRLGGGEQGRCRAPRRRRVLPRRAQHLALCGAQRPCEGGGGLVRAGHRPDERHPAQDPHRPGRGPALRRCWACMAARMPASRWRTCRRRRRRHGRPARRWRSWSIRTRRTVSMPTTGPATGPRTPPTDGGGCWHGSGNTGWHSGWRRCGGPRTRRRRSSPAAYRKRWPMCPTRPGLVVAVAPEPAGGP